MEPNRTLDQGVIQTSKYGGLRENHAEHHAEQ